jgi:hypothetical protein
VVPTKDVVPTKAAAIFAVDVETVVIMPQTRVVVAELILTMFRPTCNLGFFVSVSQFT